MAVDIDSTTEEVRRRVKRRAEMRKWRRKLEDYAQGLPEDMRQRMMWEMEDMLAKEDWTVPELVAGFTYKAPQQWCDHGGFGLMHTRGYMKQMRDYVARGKITADTPNMGSLSWDDCMDRVFGDGEDDPEQG